MTSFTELSHGSSQNIIGDLQNSSFIQLKDSCVFTGANSIKLGSPSNVRYKLKTSKNSCLSLYIRNWDRRVMSVIN